MAVDVGNLMRIARTVLSDLDLEVVLERIIDSARQLTGARYGALGVLDPSRTSLERFVAVGIDEETRREIGPPPTGRGLLGELIRNPVPLRVADIAAHPRSYGYPIGHPTMATFLGVPIFVEDAPYGNLYLADKASGEAFTQEDEELAVALAEIAGLAIDHARRFTRSESRRTDLERTVTALDATLQIAKALGGQTELEPMLQLIAKRGRALVAARVLAIEYIRDGQLVVAAGAGHLPHDVIGRRVDLAESVASTALRRERTLRLEDEPNMIRFERHGLGRFGLRAQAGLVVPLVFRGTHSGVLIAIDRVDGGPAFTEDDQRLLEAFAASAATAIATAESAQTARAREPRDATLREIESVRAMLSEALRASRADAMRATVAHCIERLDSLVGTRSPTATNGRAGTELGAGHG